MRTVLNLAAVFVACVGLSRSNAADAQTGAGIPPEITTPDRVQTRLGTLFRVPDLLSFLDVG